MMTDAMPKWAALLEIFAAMKQAAMAPPSRNGDGKAYSRPHEIESFLPPRERRPLLLLSRSARFIEEKWAKRSCF
jgi:hypothetical protein